MQPLTFKTPAALRTGLSVLASSILLSACTVGPNFVAPQTPAVKQFNRDGDPTQLDQQTLQMGTDVAPDWWQNFQSPQLNNIMQQALAGNYTLQSVEATLAQAQAEVDATAGTRDPQVNLTANAGRQKYGSSLFGPSGFHIPPFNYYTAGPQVSYLVDFAGGKRRALEQQEALREYQRYEAAAAKLTVSGNVVAQVMNITASKIQQNLIQSIIRDDEQSLALVRQARQIGSATEPDLLNAQSQMATDQARLPELEQQQIAATHALAILTGHAPADWQAPDFSMTDFRLPARLPLSLPSQLVHNRPDIMASESQLHAASAAIGVATANMYPSLNLTANITQQALSPSKLFLASSNAWAFAGGLTAPIFNGGTLSAEKRAAQSAYQSAAASYQQVVLQSFAQVADVLKALEHDAAEIRTRQQAADVAAQGAKLAHLSYQLGQGTVPQMLDAERRSHEAALALVKSKVQQYQDTALLYLALGGGTLSAPAS